MSTSTILIFSMNLPFLFIYKCYQKEIQVLLPGAPREQHLVLHGTLKLKFNIRNHRNF